MVGGYADGIAGRGGKDGCAVNSANGLTLDCGCLRMAATTQIFYWPIGYDQSRTSLSRSGHARSVVGRVPEQLQCCHPCRQRAETPAEVAALMAWVASSEARYATGAVFVVDGGMTAI
jgi:NAD(P)-dependent dehydrogenase (short-subunit alcohol dehydrogenase family)